MYPTDAETGTDAGVGAEGAPDKATYWKGVQAYLDRSLSPILIKLKIVITTYQIVSSIPSSTQASFPSSFTSFLRLISVVNLDLGSSVPVGCSQSYSYIDQMVACTLFPIALTGAMWFAYLLEHYGTLLCAPHTPPTQLTQLVNKYIHYFFFLTYLVLPSVTTIIFQMFMCTDVDPSSEDSAPYDLYLTADVDISCTSDYYQRGLVYALCMVLVYPTHSPSPSPSRMKDYEHLSEAAKCTSFLWEAYEPQFWYWERVECNRRLTLTALLSVLGTGSAAQAVLACLLGLLYIKLYGYFAPYVEREDDIVAEVGQFQIFLTFFGALIYQRSLLGSSYNLFVGVCLVAVNLCVAVLFYYFEINALLHECREGREGEGEEGEGRGGDEEKGGGLVAPSGMVPYKTHQTQHAYEYEAYEQEGSGLDDYPPPPPAAVLYPHESVSQLAFMQAFAHAE
ncbi:hypothetical protein B484DRAFT_427284 [Ochromonadaceae sp. CCMP2298]|nr:hypothetical protein B484DRAFT_427284 [Ochromonadaceae sp. CCMP2298]